MDMLTLNEVLGWRVCGGKPLVLIRGRSPREPLDILELNAGIGGRVAKEVPMLLGDAEDAVLRCEPRGDVEVYGRGVPVRRSGRGLGRRGMLHFRSRVEGARWGCELRRLEVLGALAPVGTVPKLSRVHGRRLIRHHVHFADSFGFGEPTAGVLLSGRVLRCRKDWLDRPTAV